MIIAPIQVLFRIQESPDDQMMNPAKIYKTTLIVICAALFAVTADVQGALAQSNDLGPVLDRLQRLERDIRTLNLQVSRPGSAGSTSAATTASSAGADTTNQLNGPAAARLAIRLTELEDELRDTTGKVENMTYLIDQMNLRLEKLIIDMDYRLSSIEGKPLNADGTPKIMAVPSPPGVEKVDMGAAPGTLGNLKASDLAAAEDGADKNSAVAKPVTAETLQQTAAATSVLPNGTVQQHYKFAFDQLRKAEYETAEAAFKEFISLHGDDKLVSNARYWLGESHYVRGQYIEAAETFLAAYQADEKGTKAPDALLKLGMSLGNLDQKAQACASFGKLQKEFSKLSVSIRSKVVAEKKKNDCK